MVAATHYKRRHIGSAETEMRTNPLLWTRLLASIGGGACGLRRSSQKDWFRSGEYSILSMSHVESTPHRRSIRVKNTKRLELDTTFLFFFLWTLRPKRSPEIRVIRVNAQEGGLLALNASLGTGYWRQNHHHLHTCYDGRWKMHGGLLKMSRERGGVIRLHTYYQAPRNYWYALSTHTHESCVWNILFCVKLQYVHHDVAEHNCYWSLSGTGLDYGIR